MVGFLLAIHKDRTIRSIPTEKEAATELDDRFATLATTYLDADPVRYEAGYTPTPDEILVTEYELPDPLGKIKKALPATLEALDSKLLTTDPPIAIVHVKPGKSPIFCFQIITKSNLLAPRRALLFGANHFKFNKQVGLMPTNKLDALYEGGQLYFRNELQVRRFLDLEAFFTEASDEVLEGYFTTDQFIVEDMDKLKSAATKLMRRKISRLATENVTFSVGGLKKVAAEVGLSVQFRDTSVVIPPSRKGLRDVVDLLSDAYVRGTVKTDQLYYASSKRRIAAGS